MKLLTQAAMVEMLSGIRGATFATLITQTDARLRKTGNPFGQVQKVSRVNVCLGYQYEKAVNRQRIREDSEADFRAGPRQWGTRIPGTFFVEHKGKTYLETKVERSLGHAYIDSRGRQLTDDEVAPYLPARGENRQEVEREILVRDYSLDSIRSIACRGETYLMMHDVTVPIPESFLTVYQ